MPLKNPEEHQPAPKSPMGKQAAGGGQEGSTWESPVAMQEVCGGMQGAPTREEEWEVSLLAKAGNRRVLKVVQDDQTAHRYSGGALGGTQCHSKGGRDLDQGVWARDVHGSTE